MTEMTSMLCEGYVPELTIKYTYAVSGATRDSSGFDPNYLLVGISILLPW